MNATTEQEAVAIAEGPRDAPYHAGNLVAVHNCTKTCFKKAALGE